VEIGKSRRRVRAVLVDIDDTLFDSRGFAKKARLAALRAMKKEGMRAHIRRAYAVLMGVVREFGPNYQDHMGKLLERLGEKRDARIIAAGIAAYHMAKAGIRPFPDAVIALKMMRKAGLKVYAASEGRAIKQWDKLVRLGLQNLVDGAFISEEIGVEKSPEFFRRIARRLKARPDEILVMGDRVERDFIPARKAGANALLVLRKGRAPRGAESVRSLVLAAKKAIAGM